MNSAGNVSRNVSFKRIRIFLKRQLTNFFWNSLQNETVGKRFVHYKNQCSKRPFVMLGLNWAAIEIESANGFFPFQKFVVVRQAFRIEWWFLMVMYNKYPCTLPPSLYLCGMQCWIFHAWGLNFACENSRLAKKMIIMGEDIGHRQKSC